MAELDDFSRFINTPEVIFQGEQTLNTWTPPAWMRERPSDDEIGAFRVTSATEGRPDLIADAVYGEPLLFWVLIAFNRVGDSLNWPRAGDVVEYPVDSVVFPELS